MFIRVAILSAIMFIRFPGVQALEDFASRDQGLFIGSNFFEEEDRVVEHHADLASSSNHYGAAGSSVVGPVNIPGAVDEPDDMV